MISGVTGLLEWVIELGLGGVAIGQAVRLLRAVIAGYRKSKADRRTLRVGTNMTINGSESSGQRSPYTMSYMPKDQAPQELV